MITLVYLLLWLAFIILLIDRQSALSGRLERIVVGCLLMAWILLTVILVIRGMIGRHWTFANRYEFSLCWLWVMLVLILLMKASMPGFNLGVYIFIPSLVIGTYIISRSDAEKRIDLLLPALRSAWFQLHVLSALIGFAALSLAAGMGLEALMNKNDLHHGGAERITAIGFTWLTLGILCGAVWAQDAWGRYWGWDIKETWSLVVWLWYLLILHLRSLPAWRGRRLNWLMVIGFGVLMFNFIGVPWLVRVVRLESLHGF